MYCVHTTVISSQRQKYANCNVLHVASFSNRNWGEFYVQCITYRIWLYIRNHLFLGGGGLLPSDLIHVETYQTTVYWTLDWGIRYTFSLFFSGIKDILHFLPTFDLESACFLICVRMLCMTMNFISLNMSLIFLKFLICFWRFKVDVVHIIGKEFSISLLPYGRKIIFEQECETEMKLGKP